MPTLAKKKPASRRQLAYIERLRAENLRLEKENLELRMALEEHTGKRNLNEPPQKAPSPSS